MPCPDCGSTSSPGAAYCGVCGCALTRTCGRCGGVNPEGFSFCGHCGSPFPVLAAPRDDARGSRSDVPPPAAERRQLTVMFCDLVGSTSLSAQLDPEALREIVRSYQSACAEVIERHEGYVAQYLGDGVLAYFGYPVGTEYEAGRAIRSALEIIPAIGALSARLEMEYAVNLSVRIGIHTGLVVVGEIGGGLRREHLALGETPNVAARIQGLAEPNTVVISHETYQLARREFTVEELGTRPIRGIRSRLKLYRVLGERRDARAVGLDGSEPLLAGRTRELELLRARWEAARRGAGQVVLVQGDPGIGKTSLAGALLGSVAPAEGDVLEGRCLPYYRTTAFWPILDLLSNGGAAPEADPSERAARLTARLTDVGVSAEDIALVASLLSAAPLGPAAGLASLRVHERSQTALVEVLLGAAADRPAILHLEDLHWADPSTRSLVARLVEQVPARPILLLLTARPEFEPPWPPGEHVLHLSLTRLQPGEVEQIIDGLAGGERLPPRVRHQIIDRADGVPYFVEELTAMVLASGALSEGAEGWDRSGAIPSLAIPATLHDSLEARLDRLGSEKDLAQLASILGREFSYELICAVADLDEETLRDRLERLVDAGLLVPRGSPPHATYGFKHALIQEVAYQSLLKGVRASYHLRVARTLEERFPERAEAEPEVLAQHYGGAGMPEAAIGHWTRAGWRAVTRSSNTEALSHVHEGLSVLESLSPGARRDKLELSLLLARGPAIIGSQGYAAPAVRENYLRAVDLARRSGAIDQHFQALGGLFTSYLVTGELAGARQAAIEAVGLAEASVDPAWTMASQVILGICYLESGGPGLAREHLQRGIDAYRPEEHFALAHWIGQDFGVAARVYMASTLFALGYPDRALETAREARDLARRLDHPHSLAFALAFSSSLAFFRREPERLLELTAELRELSERAGFHHWLMRLPRLDGWALVEMGRTEDGLALAASASPTQTVRSGKAETVYACWLMGEMHLRAGRVDDALAAAEMGRALLSELVDRPWWAPNVVRIAGVAMILAGRPGEGEAVLQSAIESAAAVGAKVCLLRALTDLARLGSGGPESCAPRLGEVLHSFSEGLELRDLREAAEMLRELSAGPPALFTA